MPGSKMVLLAADVAIRDRIRSIASMAPVEGLHVSVCAANGLIDDCVRDTRRALFDGPLAVLARDGHDSLLALSAGADEAYAIGDFSFDAAGWLQLVKRTQLRSEARQEAAERLAAVRELEKLCALGRLVSGVAEELSDPLSSALISLELLQIDIEPLYGALGHLRNLAASGSFHDNGELASLLARVRSSPSTATRAHAMLADVSEACEAIAQVARELGLGPEQQDRPEFFDLRRMLDKILRLFERAAGRGTHIERDYPADLPELFAPRTRVAQALISLLANALASVRAARREVHRLHISLRANEGAVTLTIADTRTGSSSALLEGMASSSSGDKAARSSVGLELSVARSTLRSLGGDLLVESLGGEGATFVAWLPRPKERELSGLESGVLPRPERPLVQPEAPRCVLVLETDPHVLGALSRLLRERYDILLAQDCVEARRAIVNGARPDAILAAVDDADGLAFVRWLFGERVDLARKLLLTSSQPELLDDLSALPCLRKPLEPGALFRGLEERFVAHLRKVVADAKGSRRAAG